VTDLRAAVAEARRTETEQLFGLRKTWFDPAPGIEMVQLHFAWTPPGKEPDWDGADSRVMTPHEASPRLRTAVIEAPRQLDGSREYLLHHFFFVVRGTEWVSSPVFTEEIVTREITYTDDDGRWTHVGLAWGVSPGNAALAAPNYTAAAMDGLTFEDPGAGAPAEPAPIHEFVQARPLPHVFRGLVWGPRGAEVGYVVHLLRTGAPDGNDEEVWADDGGARWTLTL